jgi:hypothetical protein
LVWALAFGSVLAGCNRSNEARTDTSTAAEAHATDAGIVEEPSGTTTTAALTFQVFQEDSSVGVAAEVSRLDDTGTPHYVADIDDSGVVSLAQACNAGDRFEAKPKVEAFLRVTPQPCAPTVTFRLYTAQATYALIRLAEGDEQAGNFADAQAKYGLAAERLQVSLPHESERVKVLANRNVGKLLQVDQPIIFEGGKDKVSPQMVEKLEQYQIEANIPVTGIVDKTTRDSLLRAKTVKLSP